jgi:hypothetical protein
MAADEMTTTAPSRPEAKPKAPEKSSREYCHLTSAGSDGWQLGRPLCGADALRCNKSGTVIWYEGKTHCPRCGKPICPTCRSMKPGR